MTDARHITWLHAELDGELNLIDRARLAYALARSAGLRALRADLHELAAALRQAAPAPAVPESLHQRILDSASAAATEPAQDAPSPTATRSPTFRAAHRIGRRTTQVTHTHDRRGNSMNKITSNRKTLVVSLAIGVAALAGGVAYMGGMFPHGGNEMAAATIAPAQRYEATQVSGSDVKLGNQAVSEFTQTDTYRHIVSNPGLVKLLNGDELRMAFANPAFRAALSNADFRAAMSNANFRAALMNANMRAALSNADFRSALSNADFCSALSNADFRSAMMNANFRAAMSNANFRAAMSNANMRAALSNADFRAALSNADFRAALSNADFRSALSNADFRSALSNADFRSALSNADFRSALSNANFRSALSNANLHRN